jgi:hypothetical protein
MCASTPRNITRLLGEENLRIMPKQKFQNTNIKTQTPKNKNTEQKTKTQNTN